MVGYRKCVLVCVGGLPADIKVSKRRGEGITLR